LWGYIFSQNKLDIEGECIFKASIKLKYIGRLNWSSKGFLTIGISGGEEITFDCGHNENLGRRLYSILNCYYD